MNDNNNPTEICLFLDMPHYIDIYYKIQKSMMWKIAVIEK